ncbi:biopolymer transport protein ExbD [Rhodobacter sp. JA431]|uniref:ExbD/TolR family protein n=1 Tax=Rhodobacter sp. JA431 TaxID=570013 RepID=UPI000BD174E6|nr:biopolymer transporter ExbD [Rhodobacter sp. JA431]SOC10567.1 biopolymer transport protein ExbD [Rhodobacter sp. JA431]
MLDTLGSTGKLPASERRYGFTLMPLADAMMQLLIFFMLSSSLSTYSLIDLRTGPPLTSGSGTAPSLAALVADTGPDSSALWSIEPGFVIANGQRFGFDTLPLMVGALKQQEAPKVLLILRKGSSVQDLVVVLEALSAGGVADVQIVTGEAG